MSLLLALGGFPVQAAVVPTPAAPAPLYSPIPAYDWTGLYVGANLGYSFPSDYNADTQGSAAFMALGPRVVLATLVTGGGGPLGGVQAGYNYQFLGPYVVGVEADIDGVKTGGGSTYTSAPALLGSPITTSAAEHLEYIGTVRLRLGYTLFDRWMLFATGGFAYGGVQNSQSVVLNAAPGLAWSGSSNQLRTGYAGGGGVEYALTRNITLRGEYLYYNLGSTVNYALGNSAVRSIPALNGIYYVNKTTAEGSLVRFGADYKF